MIDVYTDTPRNKCEEYLFALIKKFSGRTYEEYGNTVMSTNNPTPDNPATFTNVIYTQTQAGYGTELRGIGDAKDKITVKTGERRAWVERHILVVEFDGTENWIEYNPEGAGQGLSFQLEIPEAKIGANTSISSHFRYVLDAWGAWYINTYGIYTDHRTTKNRYFRRPFQNIDTVQKFKDWLAEQKTTGTPVTGYFILNEPVIEEIPYTS